MIRNMLESDASAVLAIYAFGLQTRNATFETNTPSWQLWQRRHHEFCRLVFESQGEVSGWVALAPTSARSCYRGVAEVSVYVAPAFQGQKIGSRLLNHAVAESEQHGIWSLVASVFPENQATLRLHTSAGFRRIGVRRRIAQLDGVWRDTILLERRSTIIGVD